MGKAGLADGCKSHTRVKVSRLIISPKYLKHDLPTIVQTRSCSILSSDGKSPFTGRLKLENSVCSADFSEC
jgi:hypothetical protein